MALLLNYPFFAARIASLGSLGSFISYLGLFIILAAGVALAGYSRSLAPRIFWATLFTSASLFQDVYFQVIGSYLSYDSMFELYGSRAFLTEALQQYGYSTMQALPANLALLLALVYPPGPALPSQPSRAIGWLTAVSPAISIVVLSVILFIRGGVGGSGLPFGVPPMSFLVLMAYEGITEPEVTRSEVKIANYPALLEGDLVLLIDESVRGDYLDINHPHGVQSGLGDNYPGIDIINLGLAVSATNCSVGSNLVLRFGGSRSDYRDHIKVMPSIWQYAHVAGFQTVYIDAQSEYKFFNGMDASEISHIDEIIQFHDVAPLYRDQQAAAELAILLEDGHRQLIIVNKLGAHFPIHDKYPPEHELYRPTLPKGSFIETAVSGRMPELFSGEWELYKNSYKNTLSWTVGQFFTQLLRDADLSKSVIIYTSDHGQTFHERNEPGLGSHCRPGSLPAIEEGIVPLLVITGSGVIPEVDRISLRKNVNSLSHYGVVSTLLQFMGYDAAQVEKTYGASFTTSSSDPLTFNSRFKARFGQPPVWNKVDFNKLIGPDS